MRRATYLLAALLLLALPTSAQRKQKVAKAPVKEAPEEDPRIEQMLSAVQKITFVDSTVVDAANFMSHIPLSAHMGKLEQKDGRATFTNEMGDLRLITTADGTIARSEYIGNAWTSPTPLANIGKTAAANPFLMPDGITLYFAQKGERSIGGYDLFVTRYDSERGTFLKAENLGMPFASTADDLFYAIDEYNQLGYFVTNRRQPKGKVCIYTFIPQTSRHTYQAEAYDEEQLRQLAAISRIADTWENKEERLEALTRKSKAKATGHVARLEETESMMSELDLMRYEAKRQRKALIELRQQYATANEEVKAALRTKILNAEQQLEKLMSDIREKEKQDVER